MDICVDFDGTCVAHDFPNVGAEIGAAPVLRALVAKGHNLILFTMRGNLESTKKPDKQTDGYKILGAGGDYLADAVGWFKKHGIPLYGINTNPNQAVWTNSPKAHGDMYIDDLALGIPLINNKDISDMPFVDWAGVVALLKKRGNL